MAKKKTKIPPLLDPMASLSGRDLRRTSKQLVNLQLRPQLGALGREESEARRTNDALARRTADYFSGLTPLFQQSSQAQSAASDALAQRLAGIHDQTMGTIDQAAFAAAQRGIDDQTLRGQGLDGGSAQRMAAEITAAKATASGLDSIAAEQATRHAGAFEGLANLGGQIAGMRGQEVQGILASQLAGQLRDIQGRRSDIRATRGPLQTQMLMDLRNQGFEQTMARKAFGLQRRGQEFEQDLARDTFNLQKSGQRHQRKMDRLEYKLARDTLNVNSDQAMAQIEADMFRHDSTPIPDLGVTYGEFARMKPSQRMKLVRQSQRSGGSGIDMGKVNEYGFTEREWRGMSTPQRQKVIRNFENDGGEGAKARREALKNGSDALAKARAFAMTIGPAYGSKRDGQEVNGSFIRQWLSQKLEDDALVEAAMDFIFNYGSGRPLQGKLRASTIKRLKQRGIPTAAIPKNWR